MALPSLHRLLPRLRGGIAGVCWALLGSAGLAATPAVLSVDASQRFTISPYIYGVAWADEALLRELRLPLNRWGGNHTSRYHWQLDVHNLGADWYFENVPAEQLRPGSGDPTRLPEASSVHRFIEANRRQGAATLLTLPMMGWLPARRPAGGVHPYDCAFRVSRYGNQTATDVWDTDCGNGVRADGQPLTGNSPQDTSIAVDTAAYSADWLRYLGQRYGSAHRSGIRFVGLDNEPELWSLNHRDVRPQPLGYEELRDRSVAHARAVKQVDAAAQTLGPSSWGWTGYFWSDLDQRALNNGLEAPDRRAGGNLPAAAWYLQAMRRAHEQGGRRLLDYFDLHFYPQGDGVYLHARTDATAQALRLRQTRALWDPDYVDESWIGEPVRLLPRMRDWIRQHYPGTRLALSEYNFGALDHLSGALAQAEVLGILGREGVGVAALWGNLGSQDPGAQAFRLYRNYDGKGGQFGSTGVRATSSIPHELSIFAARECTPGPLTLVLVNKSLQDQPATLRLGGFIATGSSRLWSYGPADLRRIVERAGPVVKDGQASLTVPAQTAMLLRVPGR